MQRSVRLGYIAHSLRSDWNNGNAHFLRGLLQEMGSLGHAVTVFEPEDEWSIRNLREEAGGAESLAQFTATYPALRIAACQADAAMEYWREALRAFDVVVLHEWNPPALAQMLLELRPELGFQLVFHDTHHRASSSPEQIQLFGVHRFDGVLAFGEVLRQIYRERFGIERVWTLHEAADTRVFRPLAAEKREDVVWVGNWGDGERSAEIRQFLLEPARGLRATIYGVRYPADGLASLAAAGIAYGGYLANLRAPEVYAQARLTVHVPRQQYATAMTGIPTIRVFEALACGIPLISAPWKDTEGLFREGDFRFVQNGREMAEAMRYLLINDDAAREQARRGRETVLARHTCRHRAEELTAICEELLR